MVGNRLKIYLSALEKQSRILQNNARSTPPPMQMSDVPWPTVTIPKDLSDITEANVKLFCRGVQMITGEEWPNILAEMESNFKSAKIYENVEVKRSRRGMRTTIHDIRDWLIKVDASVSFAGVEAPSPPPPKDNKDSQVRPLRPPNRQLAIGDAYVQTFQSLRSSAQAADVLPPHPQTTSRAMWNMTTMIYHHIIEIPPS
jgi:hypothetical protein